MPAFAPRARQEDLVVAEAGTDLVIHDLRANHIHSLNPIAAAVWRAADGRRNADAIASDLGLHPDVVGLAMRELGALDLLLTAPPQLELTRRQVLTKLAAAGIAASALPVISSITGADATAAASCAPNDPCCPDPSDLCCFDPCSCNPSGPGCGGGEDPCLIDPCSCNPSGPGCGGGGCDPTDFCCLFPDDPGCGGGGCDPSDFCCIDPTAPGCGGG